MIYCCSVTILLNHVRADPIPHLYSFFFVSKQPIQNKPVCLFVEAGGQRLCLVLWCHVLSAYPQFFPLFSRTHPITLFFHVILGNSLLQNIVYVVALCYLLKSRTRLQHCCFARSVSRHCASCILHPVTCLHHPFINV